MAVSTRIQAKNIVFKIGTVDLAPDATMVSLTLGDASGDVRTFAEVSTAREWKLQLDGIVSGDTASLYRTLWANYGTEVAFVVAPSGNSTASTTQPHYTGTVIFDDLPPLELTSGETAKFSVTLTVKNTTHNPTGTPAVFWGVTLKTT